MTSSLCIIILCGFGLWALFVFSVVLIVLLRSLVLVVCVVDLFHSSFQSYLNLSKVEHSSYPFNIPTVKAQIETEDENLQLISQRHEHRYCKKLPKKWSHVIDYK
jgi:hypothetical protein